MYLKGQVAATFGIYLPQMLLWALCIDLQLICPAKREVLVLGSPKQAGTLLPKAPKGWGWRTAFLFDELPNLLQGGSLRVAAVVQLV
jgi:hypothetical protein